MIFLNASALAVLLSLGLVATSQGACHYSSSDDDEELIASSSRVTRESLPKQWIEQDAFAQLSRDTDKHQNSALKAQTVLAFLKTKKVSCPVDIEMIRGMIQGAAITPGQYPNAAAYLPGILGNFGVQVRGLTRGEPVPTVSRAVAKPSSQASSRSLFEDDQERPSRRAVRSPARHLLSKAHFTSLGAQIAKQSSHDDRVRLFCAVLHQALPGVLIDETSADVAFGANLPLQDILENFHIKVGDPASTASVEQSEIRPSSVASRRGFQPSSSSFSTDPVGRLSAQQFQVLKSNFDVDDNYRESKIVRFLKQTFPRLTQSDMEVVRVSLADEEAGLEDILATLRIGVEPSPTSFASAARYGFEEDFVAAPTASSRYAEPVHVLTESQVAEFKRLFNGKNLGAVLRLIQQEFPNSFSDETIFLVSENCSSVDAVLQNLGITVVKEPKRAPRRELFTAQMAAEEEGAEAWYYGQELQAPSTIHFDQSRRYEEFYPGQYRDPNDDDLPEEFRVRGPQAQRKSSRAKPSVISSDDSSSESDSKESASVAPVQRAGPTSSAKPVSVTSSGMNSSVKKPAVSAPVAAVSAKLPVEAAKTKQPGSDQEALRIVRVKAAEDRMRQQQRTAPQPDPKRSTQAVSSVEAQRPSKSSVIASTPTVVAKPVSVVASSQRTGLGAAPKQPVSSVIRPTVAAKPGSVSARQGSSMVPSAQKRVVSLKPTISSQQGQRQVSQAAKKTFKKSSSSESESGADEGDDE